MPAGILDETQVHVFHEQSVMDVSSAIAEFIFKKEETKIIEVADLFDSTGDVAALSQVPGNQPIVRAIPWQANGPGRPRSRSNDLRKEISWQ